MKTQFETERLKLRPVQPRDLDDLATLEGDPAKMKYISPPLSRHQMKETLDWMISEWSRLRCGWFAVFEKGSGKFVGQAGLQCFEHDPKSGLPELAFVLCKESWGKGYALEAARGGLRFGFEQRDLEKIVSVIDPENLRPQKTLEELGFSCLDERSAYGHRCKYYEITREEFEARNLSP
jgi:RimJ/RimL family protein N-acetyltransferase